MDMPAGPPIALVGLMGAGKSAVARELGARLGGAIADLDATLEAIEGLDVAGMFARSGEAWFRRREREVLADLLDAGTAVVACGGGSVVDADCRRMLRERCFTVWLDVTPAEAARRVGAGGGDPAQVRPMLAGGAPLERLRALAEARAPLYADVARVRIDTTGLAPADVADRVLAARGARP